MTVSVPQTTVEALSVISNGTYTADTGKAFSPVTVNVPTVNRGMLIQATAPAGATVTATKDGVTYTGVEDPQNPGSFTIEVPNYGTYTVTASGELGKSETVTLTAQSVNVSLLPAEYKMISWLGSNGDAYINTGLVMNGFHVKCNVLFTSTEECAIIGLAASGGPWYSLIIYDGNLTPEMYRYSFTGEPVSANVEYAIDYSCVGTDESDLILRVNGSDMPLTLTSTSPNTVQPNRAVYLLGYNHPAATNATPLIGRMIGPVYLYDTADETGLVGMFVPCVRIADDVAGMYDTVRQQFFTNAGTGAFIAGPDVA